MNTNISEIGQTILTNKRKSLFLSDKVKINHWIFIFVPAAMLQFVISRHTVTAVDVWLLLFAILQYANAALHHPRHLSKRYFIIYILGFVFYLWIVAIGLDYAADKTGVIKEFAKWLEIFLISVGVALYAKNLQRFANMYWATFCILVGFCLYFMIRNLMQGHLFERMYVNPDWAIALSLPFLTKKRFWLIYVLILMPCLILSYSRLTWASTALEIGIFQLLSQAGRVRRRRMAIALAGILTVWGAISICVPSLMTALTQRVMITFTPQFDQSAVTRGAMIRAGLMDFMQHPLYGVGAGNFKSNVIANQANKIDFWLSAPDLPNSPHSVIVQTAAELGLPGLLALGCILIIVLAGVRRGYESGRLDRGVNPYATGMVLFLVPLAVTLLASNIGDTSRVLWGLYFGLALVMCGRHKVFPIAQIKSMP